MRPSESQIVSLGREHGLLDATTVAQLDARATLAEEPASEIEVAKLMVDAGVVTLFQAKTLLAGHPNNLFAGPYKLLEPIGENDLSRHFRAEHRETGALYFLCIQKPTRIDRESTESFRRGTSDGSIMSVPTGKLEEVMRVRHVLVAAYRPVGASEPTAEFEVGPTVDGLPVVGAGSTTLPFDLDPGDGESLTESGAFTIPDVALRDDSGSWSPPVKLHQRVQGHGVAGYAVAPAIAHKAHRRRTWLETHRGTLWFAAVTIFVFAVLIVLVRSYLSG